VRLRQEAEVGTAAIDDECRSRAIRAVRVFRDDLGDPRMQNMAVLAEICRLGLVPGVNAGHCEAALDDLLAGAMLEKNLALFRRLAGG
jgi:hypothetical protein